MSLCFAVVVFAELRIDKYFSEICFSQNNCTFNLQYVSLWFSDAVTYVVTDGGRDTSDAASTASMISYTNSTAATILGRLDILTTPAASTASTDTSYNYCSYYCEVIAALTASTAINSYY